MRIGDGQSHLGYCTNIYPGETWAETLSNLQRHLPALKQRVQPHGEFGVGLRLSAQAATELRRGDQLPRFRDWLAAQGLYVFTLNGFPYGGFHGQRVKDSVYAPDWRTEARLDYTLDLAHILAALLPPGGRGSVSTVPLSYKHWPGDRAAVSERCCRQLAAAVERLHALEQTQRRHIDIVLEPEPDCLLETSAEVVDFFTRELLPVGGEILAGTQGIAVDDARALLLSHVGVCFDACHMAVEFEQPRQALERLTAAGIRIGKAQLSSALRVNLPHERSERRALGKRLADFAESTYLHQVVERAPDGGLRRFRDLGEVLPDIESRAGEWRVHFHVPLFWAGDARVGATQQELLETIGWLQTHGDCREFEIETYTWDVLPPALKGERNDSMAKEFDWVLEALTPSRAAQG